MKNKYYFFKKLYSDYVIVLESKGKYKSIGYDKLLLKYIKNGDLNYIIVYHDFSITKYSSDINNYKKYLIKEFIFEMID